MGINRGNTFAIVSLGRRGGSIHLTDSIIEILDKLEIQNVTFKSNNSRIKVGIFGKQFRNGFFSLKWAGLTIGLVPIISSFFAAARIILFKPKAIIFIMPQPFDFPIRISAKIFRIKTYSIIHEISPHLGEWWPNKYYTFACIKLSNKTIVFSNYVKDRIQTYFPNIEILITKHPVMYLSGERTQSYRTTKLKLLDEKYVLFIGRIEKYKGLDNLFDSWKLFQENNYDPNLKLVIAGQGKLPENSFEHPSLILMNEWISEALFEELILNCQALVLPYTEASQSGILALRVASSKKKIITSVGGLIEQMDSNTLIIPPNSPDILSRAIKKIILMSEVKAKVNYELDFWRNLTK